MSKLAWGIIGTGSIAKTFATALAESNTGELIAVGSRTRESADKFADQFGVSRRYGDYESLLADTAVEAVYISTPHPMHAQWAIAAAEAGKHILCEKPLTLNYPEAMAVVDAAERNDVFLMEAFMYRCHPQTAKLVELIRDRAIGDVRVIQAAFSFNAGPNLESRLLADHLGGGGILDVGCYCASMARLTAGAATGADFAEPIDVKAVGHVGELSGVDEYTAAVLKFPGDIVAQLSTGVQVNQENVVRIFGSKGSIYVPSPWIPGRGAEPTKIIVHRQGVPEPEEIVIEPDRDLFTIEADTVADNIANRQAPSPCMTWDDTLGNMKTLDRWRTAIGMVYAVEKADAAYPSLYPRPAIRASSSSPDKGRLGGVIPYAHIQNLNKPVSRLVMGVTLEGMLLPNPHTSIMFDTFFQSGGNCFDTAHIYAGGWSERLLGQWINSRGVRDNIVILDKGAHTPHCNPQDMTSQLFESLERLQTDYIDIYMLHRDNEDVPVQDFIDNLNMHIQAGRIRAIGASNWTLERVEAANNYAKSGGLVGFTAISNQFSLARMVDPVWDGCLLASDPESRKWFETRHMPLMAWSSTGRGFFVRGNPDDLSDADFVRCWHSEDNFLRLQRARELAAKHGVSAINIATAYVLNQPFPTFALFGPQTISEMRASMRAFEFELTPAEMRYLDMEDNLPS